MSISLANHVLRWLVGLHVVLFQDLELLLRTQSFFGLLVQHVCLIRIEPGLQRNKFAYCSIDLSKARGSPDKLLTAIAAHMVVLILHGLDIAVGNALHTPVIGIHGQHALITILLMRNARAERRLHTCCPGSLPRDIWQLRVL